MSEIPFGFHRPLNKFVDAGSVPKGRACNCVCDVCKTSLEAVHPIFRKKHFRHSSLKECKGARESLFHKVAKQILKENSEINLSETEKFAYDQCNTEYERHGKRPDAYLTKDEKSIIVEIYFTHHPAENTLAVYREKGEEVLEVDISSEKMQVFNYDKLRDLVLYSAARQFIGNDLRNIKPTENTKANDSNWFLWIILSILTIGVVYLIYRKQRRRRF